MDDKFNNIPVEDDTTILLEQAAKFGNYDIWYQKWKWEGINAESIIFLTNDINTLDDNEIKTELRSFPIVNADSEITIKRTDSGYTFANFNFEA